jgi:DNA-binding transcriptional ArsR family regulator
VDEVFKALADPSRRVLLDELFARDGRTLAECCEILPAMTRFGVMKHLGILESAGLVVTRRVGREKYHYLNPVPIQLIADRWISKYAAPLTRGLVDLKDELEAANAKQREDGAPCPSTSTRSTSARPKRKSGTR